MDDTEGTTVGTDVVCIGVGVGVGATEVRCAVRGVEEPDGVGVVAGARGVALAVPRDEVEGGGRGVGFGGSEGAPGTDRVD